MTDFPDLKIKALVSFPAAVYGGTGLAVRKESGQFYFDLAFGELAETTSVAPAVEPTTFAALWESSQNAYRRMSLTNLRTQIGGGGGGGIPEAPNDGVQYGRQSLAWTPVAAGGVAEAPSDGKVYGRRNAAWLDAWASPALTGNPTSPTPTIGDNDTSIATTAFVTAAVAAVGSGVVRSYLAGLTLSNGAGAALNIAAGVAADSTNAQMLTLPSAMAKATQSSWTVGNGGGSLDTGAFTASAWYHAHLIKRLDTGVVDVATSLSAAAPTFGVNIPAAYTLSRRIGSVRANGAANALLAFIQDGDTFQWVGGAIGDVAALNPGTAAVTRTLSVPTGVSVTALIWGGYTTSVAASNPAGILLTDLAVADTVPSVGNATLLNYAISGAATAYFGPASCRTNTLAQIRSRIQLSDANISLNINTFGWIDRRGRDA